MTKFSDFEGRATPELARLRVGSSNKLSERERMPPPTWVKIARALELRGRNLPKAALSAAYRNAAAEFAVTAMTAKRARNAYVKAKLHLGDELESIEIVGSMTAVEEWSVLLTYEPQLAASLIRSVLAGTVTVDALRRRHAARRDIEQLERQGRSRIEHRGGVEAVGAIQITERHGMVVEGEPIDNEVTRLLGCEAATADEEGGLVAAIFWSSSIQGAKLDSRPFDDILTATFAATNFFSRVILLVGTLEEKSRFDELISRCCAPNLIVVREAKADAFSGSVRSAAGAARCSILPR